VILFNISLENLLEILLYCFSLKIFIFSSFQTSATTKTTTLTTPAKLYGKDLSEYDDVDVESLLAQLSPEEITILAKEVDPDVSTLFVLALYPDNLNIPVPAGQLPAARPAQ